MSVEIPLASDLPDFAFQVELDSITYGFRIRLNGRDSCWYLDLSDAQGTILAASLKLVLNIDLLRRQTNPALPLGYLMVIPTTSSEAEPGPSDLSTRVRLLYKSRAS